MTDADNARTSVALLTAVSHNDQDLFLQEIMQIPLKEVYGVIGAMTGFASELLDCAADFDDNKKNEMLQRIALRFQTEDA